MASSNQAVVEILDKADAVSGAADNSTKAIRAISGSQAFLKYDWIKELPVMNSAGDLRGMVISSRWRTVFNISGDVGEAVGRVAFVVGVAANIAQAWPRINAIYKSNASWDQKGAQMATQVSSIALRTAGGVIPATASIAFLAAQGYCQVGPAASVQQCVQTMKGANNWVSTTFKKVTDGDNIYMWINAAVGKAI